ncbi:acetyltransferase [Paenisporosarcina sp. TG-14]|uniref:acetyltransferase n=1 Tax=Paenisporosarcina sp. TG-14 TaxID=1231057 RepID=UPI000319FCC0|nr:acetyltransferase [Paenisporosarcina sp. TG-14]
MKEKLLIIGASGHGKVVADIALKMNKWPSIAFLDDDQNIKSSLGKEVIGTINDVFKYLDNWDVFVGVGNNSMREKIQDKLETEGASIPILIHPNAVIGKHVEIAGGTVVMAGVVINCCTEIGKGCIINTGASLDHDNLIGNYVHVSPGTHLAGTVTVGQGSWLGIGSIVSNNVKIASGCKVGAGAVVIKDISEIGIYVGIPARKLE